MRLKFNDKSIKGIFVAVPDCISLFDDEIKNYEFSEETSRKLRDTMGYHSHRLFPAPICVSDVAVWLLERMIADGHLSKDSIDALILVTETPDQPMPPTSNIIQGRLGLKSDMICLDINQGCAGFEVGIIEAFMLLEQEEISRVVLINAEMLSRRTSKRDRNSYPLIGDAVAVTVVDKTLGSGPIFANIRMDGAGAFAIQIPAGGLRLPCSTETCKPERDEYGNWRSKENLVMKGDEVFMFVQKKVPPLIEDILNYAEINRDDIDAWMFHQPNRFMLEKLARKLKVSREKMPSNIVGEYGNSSSVTVPLNIAVNLGSRLTNQKMKLCLAGFGVGLAWSSLIMDVGPLEFCKIIEYPCDSKIDN